LKDRVAAVLLAIANRGFTAFDVQIGDHYRGAFAREPNRSAAADSTRRAGDHCDFALESAHRGASSHFCSSRLLTYAFIASIAQSVVIRSMKRLRSSLRPSASGVCIADRARRLMWAIASGDWLAS